jgi:hypothetical protein
MDVSTYDATPPTTRPPYPQRQPLLDPQLLPPRLPSTPVSEESWMWPRSAGNRSVVGDPPPCGTLGVAQGRSSWSPVSLCCAISGRRPPPPRPISSRWGHHSVRHPGDGPRRRNPLPRGPPTLTCRSPETRRRCRRLTLAIPNAHKLSVLLSQALTTHLPHRSPGPPR